MKIHDFKDQIFFLRKTLFWNQNYTENQSQSFNLMSLKFKKKQSPNVLAESAVYIVPPYDMYFNSCTNGGSGG